MKVILAQPRGFCAGVVRAIAIVENALEKHDAPVFVRHEIVHNRHVVDQLRRQGAQFVEETSQIPEGAVAVFSAHGVSKDVEEEASLRHLHVYDATCPLVSKVHNQSRRYARDGRTLILIGHAGHPEVIGTMGQVPAKVHLVQSVADVESLQFPSDAPLAYVTQTTLSVDDTREIIDALKGRYPDTIGPDTTDICYATQNRQTAVRALCRVVDVLIVVGAKNSSNSNRLHEISREMGVTSHLVADSSMLDPAWFVGEPVVGITAGASAPEVLITEVLAWLNRLAPLEVTTLEGRKEAVSFRLPPELTTS